MEKKEIRHTSISALVDANYVHAYVLSYFGIRFYEYSEQTLSEVCSTCGLRVEQVMKELESPSHMADAGLPLVSYPIDLIIQYLKHVHYIFIKHKLPYIAKLVEAFKASDESFANIERDLKIVLPLFIEDFIHHIYEEEDTLFNYINVLERASRGSYQPAKLFYLLEKTSVHKFAMEHEVHDDEMEGIRKITNDYSLPPNAPLHVKVLYQELQEFEKNLIVHARIENDILFPKAMTLENQVKKNFFDLSKFN